MTKLTPWGDELIDGLDAALAIEPPTTPSDGPIRRGSITFYPNLIQGSDEWSAARCGLLTASEMKLILTPTLKIASNEKERAHLYEMLAQRITGYVEPHYISDDMLRGQEDEIFARALYAEHYAPVLEMGFITNDKWGFTLGYSPDGLVGENGMLECKSRRQKFQVETWIECVPEREIPVEYILQLQTGMLVAEREWCDFVSFSGGLPMIVVRVFADEAVQSAIVEAATKFEERLAIKLAQYRTSLATASKLIPTERRIVQEMHL